MPIICTYLHPFFGVMTFGELNASTFDDFIGWARSRRYAKKEISSSTVNKCFTLLHMICKSAAVKCGWGTQYNPFFGFKKLPVDDPYESILPFSVQDQMKFVENLPDHWKPYFRFAFAAGLRAGEQLALRPEDIDWEKRLIHIKRAMTLDEDGKKSIGKTKNKYSRRTIRLIPAMMNALIGQKKIHDNFSSEYFFCSTWGKQVNLNNLRNRIWLPTLAKAGLQFREMKQTRHTFASIALSCGENPLWIAKVMGHRNTGMIIRVYGKFLERAQGFEDGGLLNQALNGSNVGKED